ncbi:MAG: nitrogen regulation protein NR(II) [Ignavibacteria bacterium]
MEQRVFQEYDKLKEEVQSSLKDKFNSRLSQQELDFITNLMMNSIEQLIQLMREGKSAHEKFFSDIILNSIDAIVGFDTEMKIFLWNKGAENIYGYRKEEVLNKEMSFLIPEYLLRKGEKEFLIYELEDKGFLANYETERITKDGKHINVSISRFPVFDEKQIMIGSVGIVRDITKVKQLEKELKEKETLALIGEVVSGIAHSLSNPLNIISGNADYLLLDKSEKDKEYEELKTIIDEATKITKSIRHLLNFSRPLKINKQPNDIHELINNVIKNSKFIIGDRKITFKKNNDKNLDKFNFDLSQIEEVISNIITNAIQAIHQSGEIKIKTQKDETKAIIEITDSGPGIPKENLEKIFLPFFSSKEYGKGTGLGLSIARKVIKEHNGEIKVKSTIGKGTTFIISLSLT